MGEYDEGLTAQRLRDVREYLNLSQQYLSDQTGIPRSAISDIERGTRRVTAMELRRLADVFGYRVGYFLGEEEPPGEFEGPAAALARQASELTPQDQLEVRRFIGYLRETRGNGS